MRIVHVFDISNWNKDHRKIIKFRRQRTNNGKTNSNIRLWRN